jgi:hypothetical protein
MADRILTLRELNRATLARQMLLERPSVAVPQAVERLAGLQAQLAQAPYVGLWTRLRDFRRNDLARLIEDRTIIKATLMRATLHLITAEDYLRWRATLQPALDAAFESIAKRRERGVDYDGVLAAARRYIDESPRTFAEISDWLAELAPGADVGSMRYAVRTHLPLVQVPVETAWSYPSNPRWTLAESWLGGPVPEAVNLRALLFRYLAAFGPASAADFQTWSGLAKPKDALQELRPELVTYRDEGGRELLDLPDMPLPPGDAPAPERFLPEFDNLLLAHARRTRVIADAHRSQVYLPGLRVAATILVDGFVAGTWKVEKTKGSATLLVEPFQPLPAASRDTLIAEGEGLLRFVEPAAKTYQVRFGA